MKQTVTKELKYLINSAWRERLADLLKQIRRENAIKVVCTLHSDEKIYSEEDFWKRQIQVVNALLRLPTKTVNIEEEIDMEEMIEKEAENLEIWDVDDMFRSQDS